MQDYLDNGTMHESKIKNKELACPALSGFNHIAVFLRWSYSKNMLDDQLFEKEPRLKAALDGDGDVREVIATSDTLKRMLRPSYFKKEYWQFIVDIYYTQQRYPNEVDEYAKGVFGEEKYNSPEFKNEAYLFVPYDDAYYNHLSAFLDDAWESFKKEYTGDPDFLTSGSGEKLTLLKYLGDKEEVIIPDGFFAIGDTAFEGCEGVKKVVLPASVKQIQRRAFMKLNSLEQVVFPEGLEKIEAEAFSGCKNLREVKLPESLKDIDFAIFYGCENLEKLEYGKKIKGFPANFIHGCNKIEKLTIPESFVKMDDINGMYGLKALCVESDLKKNKKVYIIDCPELTDITFPEGFEPKKIFVVSCPKAEHVTIGNKVFNVEVKKNVGKLVDPDKDGASVFGNIKAFFGKEFSGSDKKGQAASTDEGNSLKFHYDEEQKAYLCEYKGIVLSNDAEPDENLCNKAVTLAENYISHLDEIIEFMLPDLEEIYGEVTEETVKAKLGKPRIDLGRYLVTYLEQSFDGIHIFEFEFMDEEFEALENFTIDG